MNNKISTIIFSIFLLIMFFSPIANADVQVINGYDDNNQNNAGQVVVTDGADGGATSSTPTAVVSKKSSLPLDQRVTILERQVANLTQYIGQINQLQSQIQDLRGQLEIEKHTVQVLQDQVRSQYQDLDQRLTQAAATKTTTSKNTNSTATDNSDVASASKTTNNKTKGQSKKEITTDSKDTSASAASANDQKAYQSALGLLKNKKYSQATIAFQKFIKQYPASTQVNEGRFWLGQLYILQGQPDKAITEFNILLKKEPNSKRAPDIILQQGLAYYAKGDAKQAQIALKKVIQKYPTTSAAKLAQSRLKLIQQADAGLPSAALNS